MTKYLGGVAPHEEATERESTVPNVLQADRGPLRFYALLWATGRRQWRPDRTVFPHLVNASQEWYGDEKEDDDADTYVDPQDLDVEDGGGTAMVDVDARPVDFESFAAEGPPT